MGSTKSSLPTWIFIASRESVYLIRSKSATPRSPSWVRPSLVSAVTSSDRRGAGAVAVAVALVVYPGAS